LTTPSTARAAKNEGIFRAVNEQIRTIVERFSAADDAEMFSFVCEWSRPNCIEEVSATLEEYRAVREHPTRFLILADYLDLDRERIIGRTDRFAVVEKLGLAGAAAEEDA
jgi:hypothetical protein